uniref:Programmed cell death protein putative n=1 Tax=Albugo laibachii Nc14 TaxID=890382 RepID=F0WRW7_9STRA|nr:programmed cell death protein putative [Albugo laibachii Nc14]|eukprot:CCA24083.1 programmed cell death protein putative [Albugo laibachii Nc14]
MASVSPATSPLGETGPRRERSESRDAGKRMGGGQKGIWCNATEVLMPVVTLDKHDPNFDSESEDNVVLVPHEDKSTNRKETCRRKSVTLTPPDELAAKELAFNPPPEIKKVIVEILEEFFVSGDYDESREQIIEKVPDEFKYDLVKRAITIAMDKHDKEREMASRFLSELYLKGLTPSQIQGGFRRVLLLAEDLEIDIPSAKGMLAIFCARAVVDEIVPPNFLEDPFLLRYSSDIAAEAIKKLSIHHGTARMEKGWGPGDGRPVEELKIAIDQLTKEYILSRDLDEATRCVRELNEPYFHHELVKRGIANALEESGEDNLLAMASLFEYLVTQDIVSKSQLLKGFEKFQQILDEIVLDIPAARLQFETITKRAINDGILPRDFFVTSGSNIGSAGSNK